jgi:sodium-dependent dicarboxylate transporter 2/3/5
MTTPVCLNFLKKGGAMLTIKSFPVRYIPLLAGPVLAIVTVQLMLETGWERPQALTAGVTVLCALWWIFEALPLPVTALVPVALFPPLSVLDHHAVAQAYGNPLILLMLGGFILSAAMARSGAHRRLALFMVNLFGRGRDRNLVFGFMAASALLSMWVSNTATTLMLLPVALAVLETAKDRALVVPLLLGICYAASVGGIGTPIGTPPNLVFMKVYSESTGVEITFLEWMKWGIPVVVCFVPLIAWYLTRRLTGRQSIELPATGTWQPAEKRVMILFALTAVAWMFRKEPFGGWSSWFDIPGANDASVALISAVLLFLIPDGRGGRLMDWDNANKIPWGILLLFGGGIAIASAFKVSGLSTTLAQALTGLESLPVWILLLIICLSVTFLTEMTSNTATTTLLMPILAAAGIASGVDPALLMVPAAMSASCAFMLPVATPTNAIIFGSGQVAIGDMVRRGLFLNLIGAVLISFLCYWLIAN